MQPNKQRADQWNNGNEIEVEREENSSDSMVSLRSKSLLHIVVRMYLLLIVILLPVIKKHSKVFKYLE